MSIHDKAVQAEETFVGALKRFSAFWSARLEGTISRHQLKVLSILSKEGPQKFSALADALILTPGAITGISDRLVEGGYAERIRDQQDRRIVYLSITPEGKQVADMLRKQKAELLVTIFSGLSEEDLEHFQRIFNKMVDNLEDLEK